MTHIKSKPSRKPRHIKVKPPRKPAKPKRPKGCNCFEAAQKQLAEKGWTLESALQIDFTTGRARMGGPFLAARWLDGAKKKGKVPLMCCAYCPFCGRKNDAK